VPVPLGAALPPPLDSPEGGGGGEAIFESFSAGSDSLPIFFSQPRMAGSFPLTHPISMPFMSTFDSGEFAGADEAHTAPYASPMVLNGTRAVAWVGAAEDSKHGLSCELRKVQQPTYLQSSWTSLPSC
jgi:hypothetical protein